MTSKKNQQLKPVRHTAAAKKHHESGQTAGVRLNKVIASSGLCSRRKADEYILTGKVTVNGCLEMNPARHVTSEEKVTVAGKDILQAQKFFYFILHKPVQTVCTLADPQGRPTVIDCLPEAIRTIARLYPVGRLDYFSEGLLLLTNDGLLAQHMSHPRHHLPKTYEVIVREKPSPAALAMMREGMILAEGEKLLPVEIEEKILRSGNFLLRMVLRQGINRQIRRMCRDLGLTILRLRRVAQGPLLLGELPRGQVRELTAAELTALRQSVQLA